MDRTDLAAALAHVGQAEGEISRLRKSDEANNYQKNSLRLAAEALQRAKLSIRMCAHKEQKNFGEYELEPLQAFDFPTNGIDT